MTAQQFRHEPTEDFDEVALQRLVHAWSQKWAKQYRRNKRLTNILACGGIVFVIEHIAALLAWAWYGGVP